MMPSPLNRLSGDLQGFRQGGGAGGGGMAPTPAHHVQGPGSMQSTGPGGPMDVPRAGPPQAGPELQGVIDAMSMVEQQMAQLGQGHPLYNDLMDQMYKLKNIVTQSGGVHDVMAGKEYMSGMKGAVGQAAAGAKGITQMQGMPGNVPMGSPGGY